MRLDIIEDMLNSIRRLNDECESRVKFEQKLLETIEEKDKTIQKYISMCNEKDKEIDRLDYEYKELEKEALSFKSSVEKMFLSENEMFVKEDGVLYVDTILGSD